MIGNIDVNVMGEKRKVPVGITYFDLANEYQDRYKYPILFAKVGNV